MYIFRYLGEWKAVVFEEARTFRYLLVYNWEGGRWRRWLACGYRGDERLPAEVVPRHAPIAHVYHPLMSWGELMAVVECDTRVWIVIYQRVEEWRPMMEYLLPSSFVVISREEPLVLSMDFDG